MKRFTEADSRSLLVDTWGWLVLADSGHPAHRRVVALRRQYTALGNVLVSTDFILDELITRLFATRYFSLAKTFCEGIFQAQRAGLLTVERITPERFEKAYRLRLRYQDKPRISFTDLTTITVMHELGIRQVLTEDAHFVQVQLGFQKVP
ncbi:MAG: type II toxin-antitoxin system VapC family toxin [Acidobacteria bacterium]|nr:type II toxin-antitoxin system VapC family toxin [Acidobacteriota bacterium]